MADYQQHSIPADVHLTAEQDAESDARKIRWVFIGVFGNILGILIASIYEPTPPVSRFLGRSPEYVAMYTEIYKAKSRSVQVRQSLTGIALFLALAFVWAALSP